MHGAKVKKKTILFLFTAVLWF